MPRDIENTKKLQREWYQKNKDLVKERARAWASANPDKRKVSVDKWRTENLEQHNATNRNWNINNKPLKASLQAKRKSAILQRTPAWDKDAHLIVAKYQLANMLTRETGIPHHVDHIIPLQGKKVSGLHTFANLRVIPGSDNVKKSNKYII